MGHLTHLKAVVPACWQILAEVMNPNIFSQLLEAWPKRHVNFMKRKKQLMIEHNHGSKEETSGASTVHLTVNQAPLLLKEEDI